MSTAEQKIKAMINNSIQHEGEHVMRWLTGGNTPGVHVTFKRAGTYNIVRCPICESEHGKFDASYGKDTYQQLISIHSVAYQHKHATH